ncbi:MAG: MFS transporter [Aeromonas media]|nr:MAG: MFS transporter [Aeromonas media]
MTRLFTGGYWYFICQQWPLLMFGFLTVFIGNVGQSFFLSWYGAHIQSSLGMSASNYGFIYAIATLSSSLLILFTGSLIDRYSTNLIISIVSILLALSCILMANVSSALMLFFSFLGLRFAGQGLFPHTAQTIMIRTYTHQRGKALSLSASGVAVGEMVLPTILMSMILLMGWRESWLALSCIIMFLYLPCAFALLRKSVRSFKEKADYIVGDIVDNSLGRRDVIRDWRFWSVIPAVLSAPFIVTGVFIQQGFLLEQKGWSAGLLAGSFVAYGFLHWISSMWSGSLVDRYGAKSLLPFLPIPIISGLLVLTFLHQEWSATLFMLLFGLGIGASSPVFSALWAEMYGTKNIGAIRSMVTSMMIFSTAAAPWIFGLLIEKGWCVSQVFGLLTIVITAVLCLLLPACYSFRKVKSVT